MPPFKKEYESEFTISPIINITQNNLFDANIIENIIENQYLNQYDNKIKKNVVYEIFITIIILNIIINILLYLFNTEKYHKIT